MSCRKASAASLRRTLSANEPSTAKASAPYAARLRRIPRPRGTRARHERAETHGPRKRPLALNSRQCAYGAVTRWVAFVTVLAVGAGCIQPNPVSLPAFGETTSLYYGFQAWTKSECDPNPLAQPSRNIEVLPRFLDNPEEQLERLRNVVEPGAPWTDRSAQEGTLQWSTASGTYEAFEFMMPWGPPAHRFRYRGADDWSPAESTGIVRAVLAAWEIPESNIVNESQGTWNWTRHTPFPPTVGSGTSGPGEVAVGSGKGGLYGYYSPDTPGNRPVHSEVVVWTGLSFSQPFEALSRSEASAIANATLNCYLGRPSSTAPSWEFRQASGLDAQAQSTAHTFQSVEDVWSSAAKSCTYHQVSVDAVTGAVLFVGAEERVGDAWRPVSDCRGA